MRRRVIQCAAVLAVLAMTVPAWARTYKEELTADKDTNIGGTMLKAGSYELSADSGKTQLEILVNGKVMATVQGQWVKLPSKPQYSTVVSDGNKVTQVQFSGTDQAFQVQ
jgi:hypothetical protein